MERYRIGDLTIDIENATVIRGNESLSDVAAPRHPTRMHTRNVDRGQAHGKFGLGAAVAAASLSAEALAKADEAAARTGFAELFRPPPDGDGYEASGP